MFIKVIKSNSRRQVSGKRAPFIGLMFIMLVVTVGLSFTPILPFIPVVALAPFYLSQAMMSLKLVREQEFTSNECFTGFKFYTKTLVTQLMICIKVFLWSLLFGFPGIVKTYAYALTWYILADDPNMSETEAIALSEKMMMGHKLNLFLFDLSFIGWHILAICTGGLLYIWLTPYINVSHANFYKVLKRQESEKKGQTM